MGWWCACHYLPVQTDAQHAVVAQSGTEKIPVLASLTILTQRTVIQRDLSHLAAVPVAECLWGAVKGGRTEIARSGTSRK